MARTIQSPGVEIKEVDLSLRPDIPIGTTVLVPGFSQNGPTDELIQVTSASDFEQVYGKPTTPVERYFYHTVRSSLNSPANVFCSRLAYGEGAGGDLADKYSALVYPVFPRPSTKSLEALPMSNPLKQALVNYLAAKGGVTKEFHTLTLTTSTASAGAKTINQGSVTLNVGKDPGAPTATVTLPWNASSSDIATGIINSTPDITTVDVTGDFTTNVGGMATVTIRYDNPNYHDMYNITADNASTTLKYFATGTQEQWSLGSSSLSGGSIALSGTGMVSFEVAHDGTLSDLETALKAANTSWDVTVTGPTASTSVSGGAIITFNQTGDQGITNLGVDLSKGDPDGSSPGRVDPNFVINIAGVDDVDIPTAIGYNWVDAAGNPYDFSGIYQEEFPTKLVVQYVKDNGYALSDADVYWFGEPSNIDIDGEEYRAFQENRADYGDLGGHISEWRTYQEVVDKKGMGFILLNTRKLSINEKFEGYYVGVCDNTNLNPATDFDGFLEMKGFNKKTFEQKGASYIDVPDVRLNFSLSAEAVGVAGSISEVMENVSPFDLNNQQYSDVLSIGVFKVRPSTLNPDITKLDYVLAESYIGSCNFYAQQYLQEGGEAVSFYLEDETAEAKNFRMMVNPNISKNGGDWYDEKKEVTKKVRMATNKRESHYASKKEYMANTFLDTAEGEDLYWYTKAMNELVLDAPQQKGKEKKLHHGENLYAHGAFKIADGNSAETGNIPAKLDRLFEVAENLDLYPLDILCEAGLGTVYVGSEGGTVRFDDEKYFNIGNPDPSDPNSDDGLYTTQIRGADDTMAHYKTIANRFINFCQTLRKDCLVVLDNLRYIFVQGNDVKVLDDKANKYFSKHIYWPLRHLFGTINSSYACTYGNWVKVQDPASNRQVWVPASGFVAAAMANTDSNFQPWWAPAGFTRGLLSNINDVAFMPKQKHRDQMYKIGVNPIAMFPNDGFVIFGQKTLQSKPSAFDRINVRRMFLYSERAVRNTIKYFVFEPNTLFTRQQVINVLTPIFERIKQTQGLYDYMIVCDDRNNPPDVIDQNEMVVDIYLKPVRSAEFILVNFYATRTSQDFSELIA